MGEVRFKVNELGLMFCKRLLWINAKFSVEVKTLKELHVGSGYHQGYKEIFSLGSFLWNLVKGSCDVMNLEQCQVMFYTH